MPKQFKTYTRFDGGLNTKTNSRSIQDNELAQADNVIVDEFGVVKSCGKFADNDTDYNGSISITAAQPGYGLFQGRFDYIDATNTSTIKTFLADADASGNVNINIADGNGSFDNTPNSDGTALRS